MFIELKKPVKEVIMISCFVRARKKLKNKKTASKATMDR